MQLIFIAVGDRLTSFEGLRRAGALTLHRPSLSPAANAPLGSHSERCPREPLLAMRLISFGWGCARMLIGGNESLCSLLIMLWPGSMNKFPESSRGTRVAPAFATASGIPPPAEGGPTFCAIVKNRNLMRFFPQPFRSYGKGRFLSPVILVGLRRRSPPPAAAKAGTSSGRRETTARESSQSATNKEHVAFAPSTPTRAQPQPKAHKQGREKGFLRAKRP